MWPYRQSPRDWKKWYLSAAPEQESLPGDWDNKLSELQRMLVVRSLRLDRAGFTAASFVETNIGAEFVDPPAFARRHTDCRITPPTIITTCKIACTFENVHEK